MNRSVVLRWAAVVLMTWTTLGLVQVAVAGPVVPHKESCNGTVAFPAAGTLTFQGRGVATHMGLYTITGGNQITADGRVTYGTFTSVAADGSTITGIYFGTYTNLPNNMVRFNVTAVYQQGTGRLAGVTGQAAVVALLDLNTNTFHYDTLGTWTLP
jgi:hypothetical protein